jgi:hypothetical protein
LIVNSNTPSSKSSTISVMITNPRNILFSLMTRVRGETQTFSATLIDRRREAGRKIVKSRMIFIALAPMRVDARKESKCMRAVCDIFCCVTFTCTCLSYMEKQVRRRAESLLSAQTRYTRLSISRKIPSPALYRLLTFTQDKPNLRTS